jgi:hypothetical protein
MRLGPRTTPLTNTAFRKSKERLTVMTRLAYPDPAHVAQVMQAFPVPLRHMDIGKTVSHASTLVAPYYNTYAALLQ